LSIYFSNEKNKLHLPTVAAPVCHSTCSLLQVYLRQLLCLFYNFHCIPVVKNPIAAHVCAHLRVAPACGPVMVFALMPVLQAPKTPPGTLCLQHSLHRTGVLLCKQPGLHSQAVRFASKKDGNEKLPLYLLPLGLILHLPQKIIRS